jgi:cobyrinic acid a,c-diamide synthase
MKGQQEQNEWYLRPGETIRGHEFHYWDSTDSGQSCRAVKPDGRRGWECIHMEGNLFAGYPHLYLPSLPAFAERFVKRCAEWKNGSKGVM